MPRIVRRNLSQAVTDQLLREIEQGTFRPGDRLPNESGLMEMFQVGRNTVREAVRTLADRGVVDVRPGRGTTVLAVSSERAMDPATLAVLLNEQAVSDLYDFRLLLETEAAGCAATRATTSELKVIERRLADFLRASEQSASTWREDLAFHRSIAEASGNVVYVAVLEAVTDRLAAVRRETQTVPGAVELAAREHRAILAAIRRHDRDAARNAMAKHITSALWALDRARARAGHDGASPAADGEPVSGGRRGRS